MVFPGSICLADKKTKLVPGPVSPSGYWWQVPELQRAISLDPRQRFRWFRLAVCDGTRAS